MRATIVCVGVTLAAPLILHAAFNVQKCFIHITYTNLLDSHWFLRHIIKVISAASLCALFLLFPFGFWVQSLVFSVFALANLESLLLPVFWTTRTWRDCGFGCQISSSKGSSEFFRSWLVDFTLEKARSMENSLGSGLDMLEIGSPWFDLSPCQVWWSLESIWSSFGLGLVNFRLFSVLCFFCSSFKHRTVRWLN